MTCKWCMTRYDSFVCYELTWFRIWYHYQSVTVRQFATSTPTSVRKLWRIKNCKSASVSTPTKLVTLATPNSVCSPSSSTWCRFSFLVISDRHVNRLSAIDSHVIYDIMETFLFLTYNHIRSSSFESINVNKMLLHFWNSFDEASFKSVENFHDIEWCCRGSYPTDFNRTCIQDRYFHGKWVYIELAV